MAGCTVSDFIKLGQQSIFEIHSETSCLAYDTKHLAIVAGAVAAYVVRKTDNCKKATINLIRNSFISAVFVDFEKKKFLLQRLYWSTVLQLLITGELATFFML